MNALIQAPADKSDRNALLRGLGDALGAVAERLRALETTKRMIFLLAAQAEEIAEQARRLMEPRNRGSALSVRELIERLAQLAAAYTAMSDRVAGEISAERQLAESLTRHAAGLLRFAQTAGESERGIARREHLRPLVEGLSALAGRRVDDQSTAKDTEQMAARAAGLATEAGTLGDGALGDGALGGGALGDGAGALQRVGASLYRNLHEIADDTAGVSQRIAGQESSFRNVMTALASCANKLISAETGVRSAPAEDRLSQMVRRGRAAMDW